MSLNIAFRDAPHGYLQAPNFMTRLVATALGATVTVVSASSPRIDLLLDSTAFPLTTRLRRRFIQSCNRWPLTSAILRPPRGESGAKERSTTYPRLWFSGENLRPPAQGYSGSLSFDIDPLGGSNAYLPLWVEACGILGPPSWDFGVPLPPLHELLEGRRRLGEHRPKFMVAFVGNMTPMRLHAIRAFSTIGRVDVFGPAVGKPVSRKVDVARDFRYMLCFENDLYPGYVTEKVVEAWALGCIPVWWGLDPLGYINPQAVLNAASFASLEESAGHLETIDRDTEARSLMEAAPLLTRPPDLNPAEDVIRRAFSGGTSG